MRDRKPETTWRNKSCLSCANSFSLPAREPFDDGTVCEHDRLVCMLSRKVVADVDHCENHMK